MFAIVEIAGLQYKVEQDQKLFVNRLKGDKGGKVSFDKVLLTVNGAITVGAPAVNGITVEAEILDHVKADKVIVFKKKRRKGYKVKNGHRQSLTQIVITGITGFEGGAKKAAAKKETVKGEVLSDNATVNFGEDHELNYHLKKNNLSQSKENRETLITLGKAVKVELEKNILTHEEVDAAIIKNIDQFKALNK
ncbi:MULTISPECIES: 50S ribosomal protein L21 [Chryseobacterium]|jgi:large subunit ribosomal protein L21|uniref:Large ribosomal subunit protein bL21 n=8 Tax=Chryseobacterium TaxID=59732 RepID=A0A5B2TNP7_9FLAO|nr:MULTISPECIES: 50S ribosomal protein L21 [Chryseobacterium]KAA2216086.1 50S ribosomal protein L21 [Chryseobacterium sediminis]MBB6333302.1 large subunit ribosomal protein L21 [Chryseobacterium sediminis]MBE4951047.1 50S ribosomal protein L21 [Chryseobacterium culicis]MBP1166685.1 large subunit ribosomal protein L21 [Chryseobacterium sp. PvR013]MCP1301344.1 50S ribosomal protein L21 [Chryseobacterium sp. S0630]